MGHARVFAKICLGKFAQLGGIPHGQKAAAWDRGTLSPAYPETEAEGSGSGGACRDHRAAEVRTETHGGARCQGAAQAVTPEPRMAGLLGPRQPWLIRWLLAVVACLEGAWQASGFPEEQRAVEALLEDAEG